jgi:hypothetical protein
MVDKICNDNISMNDKKYDDDDDDNCMNDKKCNHIIYIYSE